MPFLDIRLSAPCLPEKVAQFAAPGGSTMRPSCNDEECLQCPIFNDSA